jgi:hypothetical protein
MDEAEALNQGHAEPTTEAAEKRPLSLLAREMFGREYMGDEAAEPAKVEPPVEPKESVEVEEPEEVEAEESAEPEEVPISSVSELIEHMEADPEWFNSLKVPVKVDGKPAEATLTDLVASYQIQEAAKHRLEEAKAKSQEAHQQIAKQQEAIKAELGAAAGLVHLAEQLFQQDLGQANLAKLREEDPDKYLIEKDRLTERRNALEQVKQALKQNVEKAFQPKGPDPEEFASARDALIKEVPALAEEGERNRLAKALLARGYTEEEIAGTTDYRLFRDAYKAMLYDETQAKTDAAKKKVAKVPKVLKPGAPKPQEQISKERIDRQRDQLRKSGSLDDAFALLRAKRGN